MCNISLLFYSDFEGYKYFLKITREFFCYTVDTFYTVYIVLMEQNFWKKNKPTYTFLGASLLISVNKSGPSKHFCKQQSSAFLVFLKSIPVICIDLLVKSCVLWLAGTAVLLLTLVRSVRTAVLLRYITWWQLTTACWA